MPRIYRVARRENAPWRFGALLCEAKREQSQAPGAGNCWLDTLEVREARGYRRLAFGLGEGGCSYAVFLALHNVFIDAGGFALQVFDLKK